jgi:tetratricopeptide (TPR) repeat protein
LPDYLDGNVTDKMIFTLKGGGLEKKDLAILDLIVNNNWERPIYFNYTSLSHFNVDVAANTVQEGICYRLLPVMAGSSQLVNKELMYENMMEKFSWVNLDRPDIYYSEDYRGFCQNLRSAFNTVAQEYINAGDYETARELLVKCIESIPNESIPYDYFSSLQVGMLLEVGEKELAMDIAQKSGEHATQTLDHMILTGANNEMEMQRQIIIINGLARAFRAADEQELAAEYEGLFEKYYGGR